MLTDGECVAATDVDANLRRCLIEFKSRLLLGLLLFCQPSPVRAQWSAALVGPIRGGPQQACPSSAGQAVRLQAGGAAPPSSCRGWLWDTPPPGSPARTSAMRWRMPCGARHTRGLTGGLGRPVSAADAGPGLHPDSNSGRQQRDLSDFYEASRRGGPRAQRAQKMHVACEAGAGRGREPRGGG